MHRNLCQAHKVRQADTEKSLHFKTAHTERCSGKKSHDSLYKTYIDYYTGRHLRTVAAGNGGDNLI